MSWADDDSEPVYESSARGGGGWTKAVIVIVLAMAGSTSAFAWRSYDRDAYFAPARAQQKAAASADVVGFAQFNTFQQQVVAQLQQHTQALAARQAEAKQISDQLAAISVRLATLQQSMSTASPAAAVRARPPKVAPPRISTGGTPLPVPVQPSR